MIGYLRIKDAKSIYFWSLVTGIVAGLGAVLFSYALAYCEHLVFEHLMGVQRSQSAGEIHFDGSGVSSLNRWFVLLIPAIGGLLAGYVTHRFCGEAIGTGTDAMINAFHNNEGRISGRVPLFKAVATIFTLSSGGSAGKEGPVSQIGAGFGSTLARLLGAGARARRTMLLVGMAGGLGAIFRAPLGGAITAVETVYTEDIESDSLVPAIISSVTAYLTITMIMGPGTVFRVNDVSLNDYRQIVIYVLLGLLCTALGWLFTRTFHRMQDFFVGIRIHPILKPAIGGLAVGMIGLFFPEILGSGFGPVQEAISGEMGNLHGSDLSLAWFFLSIAGLKMIATSLTVASGGSGGVFGPSLFIGGMIGGFVGALSAHLFPMLSISIPAFVLVGMGSFYGGVASAPIAGMIMVCDMIGSYALLPPLMIVSIISVTLSSRWSIYRGQVLNRFKSPAHFWDMNFESLENMPIEKSFHSYRNIALVHNSILLANLESLSVRVQASDFVVTDENGHYEGMISLRKVRLLDEYSHIRNLITVGDSTDGSVPCLTPHDSLGQALRIISEREIDKVAIVDDEKKVMGYLRYIDIMSAYRTGMRKTE